MSIGKAFFNNTVILIFRKEKLIPNSLILMQYSRNLRREQKSYSCCFCYDLWCILLNSDKKNICFDDILETKKKKILSVTIIASMCVEGDHITLF